MKIILIFYCVPVLIMALAWAAIFLTVSDGLSRGILLFYAAIFTVIATCIAGGILSGAVLNNIYVIAAINFAIVFVIAYFMGRYSYSSRLIYPSAAALLTFAAALITVFVKYSFAHGSVEIKFLTIAAVAAAAFAAVFIAAAWCSTWAYTPFREDWFFNYPQEDKVEIDYNNDPQDSDGGIFRAFSPESAVLLDKNTKEPYTGIAYVYKKHLKPNPFKPKITGLSYYINGRFIGRSAKRGSEVQNLIELNNGFAKGDIPKNAPKFVHKEYEKTLSEEISSWGNYCLFPDTLIYRGYTASGGSIAVYEKDGRLYKKEIVYHNNGLINTLASYAYDSGSGWTLSGKRLTFDSLGYNVSTENFEADIDYGSENRTQWNGKDFTFTDTYKDFIAENAGTNKELEKKLFSPEKMDFEDNITLWDSKLDTAENLLRIYGFTEDPIAVRIKVKDNKGSWYKKFETEEEMQSFIEILDRSKLSTNILESCDYHEYRLQTEQKNTEFSISQKKTEKLIEFSYYDGKIVTDKGLYVFVPDKEGTQKLSKLISKYKGKKDEKRKDSLDLQKPEK